MFCQRPFSLKVQETQGNKSEENCKTTGFSFLFSQNSGHHNSSPKLSKTWSFGTIHRPQSERLAALIFKTHSKLVILFCGVGLTRLVPIKFNPKCFLHHFWMGHCPGLCRGVAKVVGGDVRDKTSSLLLVPFDGFISLVSSDILGLHQFFGRNPLVSPHFHGRYQNMFCLFTLRYMNMYTCKGLWRAACGFPTSEGKSADSSTRFWSSRKLCAS